MRGFLEHQVAILQPKCEDNNPKSVNYFYRFWSNPQLKYGDNNQKLQNFRGFLKYQHSILYPKFDDNNQKSVNYFYLSDQIPTQNTKTIIKKDRTLEDFWNTNIQSLDKM